MVSEHMERYSQQFDMCRRKHLTSFGLVSLVYAAKLTFHVHRTSWKTTLFKILFHLPPMFTLGER